MAGKTIARYEIQSEIGRGGMAAVYLAYDPNFRRNVAVKLISGNLEENLVFRERFEREAHLIAKIEHPAIVPVYDYGEQEKQLYLVMRYMPGGSLANKMKDGVLTLRDATQIISQIAPALDAVHSQGIVHRDLKPGNILLDGFGNPAISDFGIAHLSAATVNLTGSAIIGTPSYMSPEQVRGSDLDRRSDLYALGIILFEMLTGQGPFKANTPLSLAMKHLTESVPSIRSFRPDLPLEVDSVLDKALAKDREMRYDSASELASDLSEISGAFNKDNKVPAPISVKTSRHEELSTEVDVSDSFKSGVSSSNASKIKSSQSKAKNISSNINNTQKTSQKKTSSGVLRIIAIAGGALFLFIFCSSLGLFGTWAGLSNLFSGPNQIPTSTDNVQDIVLFADDFSDPNSGWPTVQNTQGGYGYSQDGYHIFVNEIDAVFWAKTNRQDNNISIYVDARPISSSLNGYYGLLCRIQDDQNFYYFVIQSNGDYNIGKYKNAEFQPLFSEVWRQSNVINQGSQTNRLRADCSGNTLRFYVNNVLLGEVVDTDFIAGFSGIVTANLDPQPFEVIFNNFLITELSQ